MNLLKTKYLLTLLPFALVGCTWFQSSSSDVATREQPPANCPLSPGKYDVQSVTFHNSKGEYALFVLGAASCVKQPVTLEKVRLARIETADKKPQAKLEIPSGEDPTIHLTEDFKIEMVNAVIEEGRVVKEESSSWMPFLAGAAGAAVVGMAVNSMFNRPQYYQPPPPRPGMAEVRGYGAAAPTHQGAVSGYQSKYNTPPPAEANKSFFRKKADSSSMSGAGSGSQKPGDVSNSSRPSSAPQKRGFFRRRGR
jgi:hypothetical protein